MDFWNTSWNSIAPDRITAYTDTFDLGPDEIIAALHQHGAQRVCDAGCGCGIYALKLAANGFHVSGFDISSHAVEIAQALLSKEGCSADLKTASVLATGYANGAFDGVISRDVLDHIRKADAILAIQELYRITKPGGVVIFTLDSLDEEYEAETHIVNRDGDYEFTDGKWNGMVFHPYTPDELQGMIPSHVTCEISANHGELVVQLQINDTESSWYPTATR